MTDKDKALSLEQTLRLALETLEYAGPSWIEARQPAITAIKAALLSRSDGEAQTRSVVKDETVAWLNKERNTITWEKLYPDMDALYIMPPQRTWVGLTDEEIEVIEVLRAPPVHPDFVDCDDWVEFARAIESKLKEKNRYD